MSTFLAQRLWFHLGRAKQYHCPRLRLPLPVDEKAYWIAFNKVPGIGAARLSALLDLCGSIESAWRALNSQNLKAAGLDRAHPGEPAARTSGN